MFSIFMSRNLLLKFYVEMVKHKEKTKRCEIGANVILLQ